MKAQPKLGPVRKIGTGHRGVRGSFPSAGKFESTLERDLLEILRFDPDVERVDLQPVQIKYADRNGVAGTYTPDGLIHFKNSPSSSIDPILYEVKYRADFRANWRILIPKLRAAKAYAQAQGWQFALYTENEIRTQYLINARFLYEYKNRVPTTEMRRHVLQVLWDLEEADPDLLLCALCSASDNRARMIPVIWHLIAVGAIGCDLELPLTMVSRIWAEEEV